MFDLFTEEIEVIIKDGISNLYWYRGDLKKCWLRAGVPIKLTNRLYIRTNPDGSKISKRQMMDALYEHLRSGDYNRRLEISRNFVRVLVEHKSFVPQSENHRIEVAERSALKLREIIEQQKKDREYREDIQRKARVAQRQDYHAELSKIRDKFVDAMDLQPQKKGYALEKIFNELMIISGIPVEKPFKVDGEQIDGAIKHDGTYYLVELRWRKNKASPGDISSVYLKAEGKLDGRGIFISMNGFTNTVEKTLPKGKSIKVLLFDGVHFSNVLSGIYTFQELLEHAISRAATRAEIYCSHDLGSKD